MPPAGPSTRISRRDPTVRAMVNAWRRLTGGPGRGGDDARRTILACSGGGDSSALVIGLAAGIPEAAERLIVAHIIHDLRPREEALTDRDAAAALAARCGVPFVQAHIRPRAAGGNAESVARRMRYAALAQLAEEHACPVIATAHHAEDQLETILMGVLRGAGPAGMAGVAPRRRLSRAARLVRPCLHLSRADLQRLCSEASWQWREDPTNWDTQRLRAALRHTVLPQLQALRPGVERRAARSAQLLADAAAVIHDVAMETLHAALLERSGSHLRLSRAIVKAQRPVVVGALLRAAALELRGPAGQDQLGRRTMDPVVHAINDEQQQPRRFAWTGLDILVSAHCVELRRVS